MQTKILSINRGLDDASEGAFGDGEADITGALDGGDVDTDNVAVQIQQRTARVARVDGGVSLDNAS